MSCSRDKKRREPKPGRYQCAKCDQVRKSKKKLCEPKKIK